MRHPSTPVVLLALMSLLSVPIASRADEPNTQFTLTLDGLVDGIALHPAKKTGNPTSSYTVGGVLFADFRPFQFISGGLGLEYMDLPGDGFSVASLDLGGRLFPPWSLDGEFYVQGTFGRNIYKQFKGAGNWHASAGVGYRYPLSKTLALDMGVQYEALSPQANPDQCLGARLGLTFVFGKDRWKEEGETPVEPKDVDHRGPYPPGSFYTWNLGDSLKTVSKRVLGAEALYPAIVDVNPQFFGDHFQFRSGIQVKVPKADFTEEELGDIHLKATEERYTRVERKSTRLLYDLDPDWKGPSTYRWKTGDDMKSVSGKLYGDEDLYPILVNANEEALTHPANLVPGVVLQVPRPPAPEWVDPVHDLAQRKSYYIWWKNATKEE